jgi:hypothetical protein
MQPAETPPLDNGLTLFSRWSGRQPAGVDSPGGAETNAGRRRSVHPTGRARPAFLGEVNKATATTLSDRNALHGQLELHLVKLLASATGRSAGDILNDLDAWAAQLDE